MRLRDQPVSPLRSKPGLETINAQCSAMLSSEVFFIEELWDQVARILPEIRHGLGDELKRKCPNMCEVLSCIDPAWRVPFLEEYLERFEKTITV